MTGNELYRLWNCIGELFGIAGASPKFSYGIVKNKNILKKEIDSIKEKIQRVDEGDPDISTFKYEIEKLDKEYGEKNGKGDPLYNKDGSPIIKDENFRKIYFEKLKELEINSKKATDKIKKVEEFNIELTEKNDIKFTAFKIKLEHFPQGITPKNMEILMPLVQE